MKFHLLLILVLGFNSNISFAQHMPDQSTPRNTVEEIFRCARTGDFSQIHLLCDPKGENDGDTKDLCILNSQAKAIRSQFRKHFKLAFTTSEEIVKEIGAKVHFKFGQKVTEVETMLLIKRNNKWYLSSF